MMNSRLKDALLLLFTKERDDSLDRYENALSALRLLDEPGTVPEFKILVTSAWASEGEKSHEGVYRMNSVREAIRCAATDFCVLNRRIYPGKKRDLPPEGEASIWKRWDVQGSFYISVGVGKSSVNLPRSTWEKHVNELREDTEDIYGPALKAREAEQTKMDPIP